MIPVCRLFQACDVEATHQSVYSFFQNVLAWPKPKASLILKFLKVVFATLWMKCLIARWLFLIQLKWSLITYLKITAKKSKQLVILKNQNSRNAFCHLPKKSTLMPLILWKIHHLIFSVWLLAKKSDFEMLT